MNKKIALFVFAFSLQNFGQAVEVEAPASVDFVYVSSVKIKADKIVAFKSLVLPYAERSTGFFNL